MNPLKIDEEIWGDDEDRQFGGALSFENHEDFTKESKEYTFVSSGYESCGYEQDCVWYGFKDGKFYESESSCCSCYGLSWTEPVEVTIYSLVNSVGGYVYGHEKNRASKVCLAMMLLYDAIKARNDEYYGKSYPDNEYTVLV